MAWVGPWPDSDRKPPGAGRAGAFGSPRCKVLETKMSKYSVACGIATQCQRKAEATRNEDEKQSWLAVADSWLKTAELHEILERQAPVARSSVA